MNWLLPLVTGLAAIVALFASQPNSKRLAYIAAFLMIMSSGWSGVSEYQRYQHQRALKKYAYSQLVKTTRNFLGLVSDVVVYSSDGWLPQNEDDFFSSRVATLICSRLNIDSQAPVVPRRDWLTWIDQRTRTVREEFGAVLASHGSSLSPELLNKVDKTKDSFLLTLPNSRVAVRQFDEQEGTQRPPLLCLGIEDIVEKSLVNIRELYNHLWSITDEKKYPMPLKNRNLENRLGKSRFSENDLAMWNSEHPYAPSGKPPQSSGQNLQKP